jgi:hypothetical protein
LWCQLLLILIVNVDAAVEHVDIADVDLSLADVDAAIELVDIVALVCACELGAPSRPSVDAVVVDGIVADAAAAD